MSIRWFFSNPISANQSQKPININLLPMPIRFLYPTAARGGLPHQALAVVHPRPRAPPSCRAFFFEAWKHEKHEMNGNGTPSSAAPQQTPVTFSIDGRLPRPTPLGAVVNDAVRRWFLDTQREAFRGDVVRGGGGCVGQLCCGMGAATCTYLGYSSCTEAAGAVRADDDRGLWMRGRPLARTRVG